ncbi:SPOR domain-containing protein [Rhizobium sp. LCM 4573]|uniref:SPOR domain-containing protein n=1 Tax=Rhizobium sp. LCM 4573 TaxID=1848291 RepID=UPI0008D9C5B8|nr:SPOR domain-containing protein [Rhizobium sp. LCM 4573]OHV81716.1 hypothetical protein LCM4573_21845 [Rhizobium sp. LCM 4573]
MADNNLARNRNDVPDFLADDDPLAELARIVGYEDRPVARNAPPADAPRQEPTFNLEDELLREFERYDTPRLDPAHDIALDDAPGFPVEAEVAPSLDSFDAQFEPEVREMTSPDSETGPSEPTFSTSELEVSHYEEPKAEAFEAQAHVDAAGHGGYDGEPVMFDAVEADAKPVSDFSNPEQFEAAAETSRVPAFDEPSFAPSRSEQVPQADAFDLASELETSIGVAPTVQSAPVAERAPEPVRKPAYEPGFRMPLANFSAVRSSGPAASVMPGAALARAAAPSEPSAVHPEAPAAAAPVAHEVPKVEAKVTAASVQPVSVAASTATFGSASPASVPSEDDFSALDALISDVERYAQSDAAAPAQAASSPTPVPAVTPVVPAAAKAPAAVTPPVATMDDDLFGDDDFELALDELDLDLDLSEISLDEEDKRSVKPSVVPSQPEKPAAPLKMEVASPAARFEPVVHSRVSPAPATAQASFSPPLISSAPIAAPAAASVTSVVRPQPAPVAVPEPVAARETMSADSPSAFDPALIADADEHPEAIADFDVPALPIQEPEQAPVYRPDYDLDLDAELASLLREPAPAKAAPAPKEAEPEVVDFGEPARAAKPAAQNDLDEFERALEEDFRRSLATPLPAGRDVEREAVIPGAEVISSRFSPRMVAVPLAFLGVLVIGGGAIYAWMGSGSAGLGSGEPVVIAADSDPIKVLPENPGGKTVPNQDKAVYDRVAGAGQDDPKQEALISSNEEPVDVVQKTLLPETLPLEGENDGELASTPVGETEDPRLLPQEGQQTTASTSADQQPIAVMPRRVKTMVVRPDGTLVEQEVTQPAPAAQAAAPALAEATDVGGVPAAPVNTTEVASAAPVSTSALPDPALAGPPSAEAVIGVAPAEAAPAAQAPAIAAPIPTARPAEQPVNVVAAVSDRGNVRGQTAAQPAAAPAQQQTAAIPGGYVIQIASLPSEAEAQRSYQSLSSRFSNVIGGRGVDIKAATIPGKGTFYRVRIPAGSKADAVSLCERYRGAGGSCLVAQ